MSDDTASDWVRANQSYLAGKLELLMGMFVAHDPAAAPIAQGPPRPQPDVFITRPPALEQLAQIFALSSFERWVLLMCAAPELDQGYARLYASAQGDPSRTRPSFGLALATLPDAHWSALAPDAPLRHWRLIELETGAMFTSAALQIDERILHFLLGIDHLDERLAHLVVPLDVVHPRQLAPSHARIAHEIAALWSSDLARRTLPLVQLCGAPDDCLPILAAAACACATQGARVTGDLAPMSGVEIDTFTRLWNREALLSDLQVLVVELEDLLAGGADERRTMAGLHQLLGRDGARIAVTGRQRAVFDRRAALTIDVPHPSAQEQHLLWRAALTDSARKYASSPDLQATPREADLDALVAQFNLSVQVIRTVAADAAQGAPLPDAPSVAWDRCRRFLRDRMEGLAQRVETQVGWSDLVLPVEQTAILHAIVAQVRQRRTVHETWGFSRKSGRGLGTSVLFAGPSGTGKTLAAEVLANEMRLDLYRIDLSAVVSKYIGESEKALRRVFGGAEDSGAILLFDEADALFGMRSAVKDSHDRYANIQVSYLLQRMEDYRGLAILTTNQKSALDRAFLRRLRFVVQFPFPDLERRGAIWRAVFPPDAPLDDLVMERLAQLEIAGGNIHNIAMNAAFLAAQAQRRIGMRDLLVAARAEYAKLERTLSAAETEGWLA